MAPRKTDDAYMTPDDLALAICHRVSRALGVVHPPARIVDAGAGQGAFIRAARTVWPQATIAAVELRPECEAACMAAGANKFIPGDFLALPGTAFAAADLIISNPPYSLATKFAEHALGALAARPDAMVAFLVSSNFRASAGRWKNPDGLFVTFPWLESMPIVPRPSFTTDGKTERTEYELILWRIGWTQHPPEALHWEKGGQP